MLSYLHSFHAGNHADILKHITLLYTLEYFNKKPKPYTIFDTHSGRGLYDLQGEAALKTGEAANGICKLLEIAASLEKSGKCCVEAENGLFAVKDGLVAEETVQGASEDGLGASSREEALEELKAYLSFVKEMLKKGFYPGSPAFERSFLSEGSVLFLTELHKKEYASLSENIAELENFFNVNKRVSIKIQNEDAFSFLKASLPPAIKRGFVLCDPSYEEKLDYVNTSEAMQYLHKKWSGASILLWYPLLSNREEEIENMKQALLSSVKMRDCHTEVLDACLLVDTKDSHIETSLDEAIGNPKPRLYGSGMLVVNPCWGLDLHLKKTLPFLSELLGRDNNGTYSVEML